MPQAATASDAFNGVAEPRRRDLLQFMATRERPVGEIVTGLGFDQPSVSKYLSVLSEVGLVTAGREGQFMFHKTNAEGPRPLHDWTNTFEQYWAHQLVRVKELAEAKVGRRSETNSDEKGEQK